MMTVARKENTTIHNGRMLVISKEMEVTHYDEFMALIKEMRKFPVIQKYFESNVLVNEKITHNELYDIEIGNGCTQVFVNAAMAM